MCRINSIDDSNKRHTSTLLKMAPLAGDKCLNPWAHRGQSTCKSQPLSDSTRGLFTGPSYFKVKCISTQVTTNSSHPLVLPMALNSLASSREWKTLSSSLWTKRGWRAKTKEQVNRGPGGVREQWRPKC